jgi:Protein of unknown function (DUF3168)
MIADAIVYLLKNDDGVKALTKHIIPSVLVGKVISPYVIYHVATTEDDYDTDGNTGYRVARFQFDAYSGLNQRQAKAVIYAIRQALGSLRGTIEDPEGGSPPTFVEIKGTFVVQEIDMTFQPGPSEQAVDWRTMCQILIHYQEV